MWNVRNVLRQVTGRLKSSVNGNCGAQTSKEGCSELEDEYKLWTSNLWTNDILSSTVAQHAGEHPGLLFTSSKQNQKNNGQNSSDSERHDEWYASDIQSNGGWVGALGWGAALGFSLNIFQQRQDERLRNFTKNDGRCRFSPRWFTNVALSMPYVTGQPGLIRSVLPVTEQSAKRRDSFSLEASSGSYLSEQSETGSCCEFSEYQRPSYTSEAAAKMALVRQQLTEAASDYVVALQRLLSPQRPDNGPVNSDKFRRAQEEYNMGLFHELGISMNRNSDQAFKHYVEAALLQHPVAIQNIVSFHKYASAFPEMETQVPPPSSLHRCASSPVLSSSASDSGRDSVASVEDGEDRMEAQNLQSQAKRKFWSSCDEDSRSSGLSRSSSFPDLPRAVICV